MESLLSLSFDNLARRDARKIHKGLRQIEGLVAQICLVPSSSQAPSDAGSAVLAPMASSTPKPFENLTDDLAFLEFFRLQQSFEWNVATRLIECLERLLGMGSTEQVDFLIAAALDLVQGVLLLHPPSRSLFGRENHMNLLLDLLDPLNPTPILSSALLVLITTMLEHPPNIRLFENAGGLSTITSLIRHPPTDPRVKTGIADLLSFYLLSEGPASSATSSPSASFHRRNASALVEHSTRSNGSNGSSSSEGDAPIKTAAEKQSLLRHHFGNVDQLVRDVRAQSSLVPSA